MQHRFVVVGYGGMGMAHVKGLAKLGLDLAGIVDIAETRREAAAEAGLHVYADLAEALADDSVDIILIATPNEAHAPIALEAFQAGKNVITEKPAMLSSEQITHVAQAAKDAGVHFFVHQNRRWDEEYLIMKQLFNDGTLGTVSFIETRVDGSRGIPGDWRQDPERGGGMVLDWGVHLVDRLLLLVPSPVKTVYGRLSFVSGAPVDDGFTAWFVFENGVEAQVACTTNNYLPGPKFSMRGSRGTAVIEDWSMNGRISRRVEEDEPDAVPIVAGEGVTKTMAPRIVDYEKLRKVQDNVEVLPLPRIETDAADFVRNVIDVLDGKAEPVISSESVVRCMRVLEAIFASHEANQVIDLSGKDEYLAH